MKKVLMLVLALLLSGTAYSHDLQTTHDIWEWVKLFGHFAETDPCFLDTTNIRSNMIEDAYRWVQGIYDGEHYMDKFQLICTADSSAYALEDSGFVPTTFVRKIYAVRREVVDNTEAMFSYSIEDLNKPYDNQGSWPELYALDRDHIYFNSYPSAQCTINVWANRLADPDSCTLVGREPVIFSKYRAVLVLRTLALAKRKAGNEVAYANISGITQAVVQRTMAIRALIEQSRDVTILPSVFEE